MRNLQHSCRFGGFVKISCLALSVLQLMLPLSVHATTGTQQTAQNSAGATNSQGSDLSKLVSILSMASGALAMAKGAQELSCCSSGCNTGAGSSSSADAAAVKATSGAAANSIKNREAPKRFPEQACRSRWRLPLAFLLPAKVQASGCADAMMAMATGGMMMAMGMMGMMAAQTAATNAAVADTNAQNLATSSLSGGPTAQGIKIDPALLRTGQANAVLSNFENKFGIGRDDFANAVSNGKDPRDILANAPKNAITTADINSAMASGKSMTDAQKAAALEKAGLSSLQKELAGKVEDTYNAGGGGGSRSTASAKKASLEPLAELEGAGGDLPIAEGAVPMSEDLKAALEAKNQAERMAGITGQTIFQVVHNKYQEKINMIYGHGSNTGVADEHGN